MKELVFQMIMLSKPVIHPFGTVFAITDNTVPHRRQMGADLMGSSGDQFHLQKCLETVVAQRLIPGFNMMAAGHRIFGNTNLIRLFILNQITFNMPGLFDDTLNQTKIILLCRTFL